MGDLHGVTDGLDVGAGGPGLRAEESGDPAPQEVTHLLGGMKGVLGRDLLYLGRQAGSEDMKITNWPGTVRSYTSLPSHKIHHRLQTKNQIPPEGDKISEQRGNIV